MIAWIGNTCDSEVLQNLGSTLSFPLLCHSLLLSVIRIFTNLHEEIPQHAGRINEERQSYSTVSTLGTTKLHNDIMRANPFNKAFQIDLNGLLKDARAVLISQ